MTWRDRALWIAYAAGFAAVTTAYLGWIWPGGPGSAIGAGLSAAALLALARAGFRWDS